MTAAELLDLAKHLLTEGTPKQEVFDFLDRQATNVPDLAPAVENVKGILGPVLDSKNVLATVDAATVEILGLVQKRFGPVSDAPEIDLV